MRLRAESTDPATVAADVLAVPIYREDKEITGDLAALDAASGGRISQAIDWGEFNILEHYTALIDAGSIAADRILLVNGVRRGRGPWRARRIASAATRRLQGRVLHDSERELADVLDACRARIEGLGARLVAVGMLPTLGAEQLTVDRISGNPRYALLCRRMRAARRSHRRRPPCSGRCAASPWPRAHRGRAASAAWRGRPFPTAAAD